MQIDVDDTEYEGAEPGKILQSKSGVTMSFCYPRLLSHAQ